MHPKNTLLVFNSGSSSFKFCVYAKDAKTNLLQGSATALGSPDAHMTLSRHNSQHEGLKHFHSRADAVHHIAMANGDHRYAMAALMEALPRFGLAPETIAAAGHRVVHGGEHFRRSVVLDPAALATLKQCTDLAPLHNPANLLGIELLQAQLPQVPQIAVFDTAFHQTLPSRAFLYGVPYWLYQQHGVRRYGFHGISCRYISTRSVELLGLAPLDHHILIAHLGNGCSATAVSNGHSVDTTMGLTPLEGAIMGTRCGDVDPGLHQFLHHQLGWSLAKITNVFNQDSGLLGLSNSSNDMLTLCNQAEAGNQQAELAIEVFCFKLARLVGGLAMSLPRIDALIFTGGIGEHQASIRSRILAQLAILGFQEDPDLNRHHGISQQGRISREVGPLALVMATNEEQMIAQDCLALLEET